MVREENRKLLIVANVAREHIRKFHIPIIKHFQSQGWQVDVACRMDVPVPEADCTYDLPCDRNPFKGGLIKSTKILQDILARENYDAVICNTLVGSITARLAVHGLRKQTVKGAKTPKLFYIVHGLHYFQGAPLSRWAMGYPMEKLLATMTDVYIMINSSDYEMAKRTLCPSAIEQIPGIGCNLKRFRDVIITQTERTELRKSQGIDEDDFVLTYVAEINDNKNQSMLVDMMETVRKTIPNAKLLLIGPEHDGGKLCSQVKAVAQTEKRDCDIIFAGWRDDVPKMLQCADIYVASSKSEGLGINLIEAMACNLPVVAAKNRGHNEIINHGQNGFLVEPGDAKAMANYVLQLAENADLRESLVSQAQKDIQQYAAENVHCRIEEIVKRYLR